MNVQGILGLLLVILLFYTLRQGIIGRKATVEVPSNPYAKIRIHGFLWYALMENGGRLEPGDVVVVTGVRGLHTAVVSPVTAYFVDPGPARTAVWAWRLFIGTMGAQSLFQALEARSAGHPVQFAMHFTFALVIALMIFGIQHRISERLFFLMLLGIFGAVWLLTRL